MLVESDETGGGHGLVKRASGVSRPVKVTVLVAAPSLILGTALVAGPTVGSLAGDAGRLLGVAGSALGSTGEVTAAAAAVMMSTVYVTTISHVDRDSRAFGILGGAAVTTSALGAALADVGHAGGAGIAGSAVGGFVVGLVGSFGLACAMESRQPEALTGKAIASHSRVAALASLSVGSAALVADLAERIGAHPVPVATLGEIAGGALSAAAVAGAAAVLQRRRGAPPVRPSLSE